MAERRISDPQPLTVLQQKYYLRMIDAALSLMNPSAEQEPAVKDAKAMVKILYDNQFVVARQKLKDLPVPPHGIMASMESPESLKKRGIKNIVRACVEEKFSFKKGDKLLDDGEPCTFVQYGDDLNAVVEDLYGTWNVTCLNDLSRP